MYDRPMDEVSYLTNFVFVGLGRGPNILEKIQISFSNPMATGNKGFPSDFTVVFLYGIPS